MKIFAKVINLMMILVVFCNKSNKKTEEFSKCYTHLGCINYTKEWFDSLHRPSNMEPLDRHIINTKFLYLSPSPTGNETILYDVISSNPNTISITKYNQNFGVMMLIHDFTSNGYTGWIKHFALEVFPMEIYNVIAVDWQEGAEPPFYEAISNARVVAKEIVLLLKSLQKHFKLVLAQLHVIGHGIGAHIAGYVGKEVRTIGRITGLDPSGPQFEGMPYAVKLSGTDATYVEVLHTDGEGNYRQGTMEPMGNLDFYFHGGFNQPQCHVSSEYGTLLTVDRDTLTEGNILPGCSHKRAFIYYLDAIQRTDCQFIGFQVNKTNEIVQFGCIGTRGEVYCAAIGLSVDVELFSKETNLKLVVNVAYCKPYCANLYKISANVIKCDKGEESSEGYFEVMMVEAETEKIANLTFNNNDTLTIPITMGKNLTFLATSYHYAIDTIKDITIKWHLMTQFCFHCKNSTCIQQMTITHLRLENGSREISVVNQFCSKNGKYEVLYDQQTNYNFVNCNIIKKRKARIIH